MSISCIILVSTLTTGTLPHGTGGHTPMVKLEDGTTVHLLGAGHPREAHPHSSVNIATKHSLTIWRVSPLPQRKEPEVCRIGMMILLAMDTRFPMAMVAQCPHQK